MNREATAAEGGEGGVKVAGSVKAMVWVRKNFQQKSDRCGRTHFSAR